MNKENLNKFIDDVKDAFEKAIGTSSSVDQERDERTVENYVRQSGNVNTPPVNVGDYTIGGNNMSDNTTEPDPKGATAVQKDISVSQPASTDLVNQETRPTDNVSVSDAPNVDSNADVSTGGAGVYKGIDGKCEKCGQAMNKADEADEADKVEKSADSDEVTETVEKAADEAESKEEAASETPADEKAELKKSVSSVWGGAFAPLK